MREEVDTDVCAGIADCIDNHQLLNIIHFNIRSLRKNFDQLLIYLNDLGLGNVDVIVLSETRNLKEVGDFYIPGFNLYFNESHFNQNDGLAIYVGEMLDVEDVIVKLTETNLLRIKLRINNVNLGITGSYRSPPVNLRKYVADLDSYFVALKSEDVEIFIGDININILNDITDTESLSYQAVMAQNGFLSYINKPTRVTENTKSLIDHIFVRVGRRQILEKYNINLKSFLFSIDITDHFPVAIMLKKI